MFDLPNLRIFFTKTSYLPPTLTLKDRTSRIRLNSGGKTMKYWQMSLIAIIMVAVVAVAGFSIARAQDDDPPVATEEAFPFGGHMGRGGHPGSRRDDG